MGLFAYVYLSNFVKGPSVSASKILEKVSSIQGPLGFDSPSLRSNRALYAFMRWRTLTRAAHPSCPPIHQVLLLDSQQQLALFTRLGYIIAGQDLLPQTMVNELHSLRA